MSTEPGLDRHDWETQYATLEIELRDDPGGALPDLADLVERMLRERGLPVDEEENVDELLSEYRSARELSDAAERGEASHGDVAEAINSLRAVYDSVMALYDSP